VNRIGLKAPRLRLNAEKYEQLRQRVLWRDGWRCQFCGTMSNLEVHHQEFRSLSGQDTEQNLITLCKPCHSRVHEGRISDASGQIADIGGYASKRAKALSGQKYLRGTLFRQRRLRTKTLEISPESHCGGVVPPTIDST